MGILDGLKNKITESNYADKVSSGLNKIGEGLQSGSEKIHSFADSLNKNEPQETMSTENNIATHLPVIQDNNPMDVPNEPIVIQRELFSVNENDSNETRQFKEKLQDVNAVGQNLKEIVNSETVHNFSIAAREIAIGMKEYKQRELAIEEELSRITLQNQYNLDVMKLTYEHYKPLLDEMTKQLESSRKALEAFDVKNLNEEDRNTYNGLLNFISNQTSKVMSLYDKIS